MYDFKFLERFYVRVTIKLNLRTIIGQFLKGNKIAR